MERYLSGTDVSSRSTDSCVELSMRGMGTCDWPWSVDSMECVSLRWLSSDASIVSTAVAKRRVHDLAGNVVTLRPVQCLAIDATGISLSTDLAVL